MNKENCALKLVDEIILYIKKFWRLRMHLIQKLLRQQSGHTHSEGTFGHLALLEIVSLTPDLTQSVSLNMERLWK